MMRLARAFVLLVALALCGAALADVSLTLNSVLIGFTKISSYDQPDLVAAADSLIQGYAGQLSMACGLTEVFTYDSSDSVEYSYMMLTTWIGSNGVPRAVSTSAQQKIFIVYKQYGGDALGVLYALDSGGVLLITCD